jgi:hypothetical protein
MRVPRVCRHCRKRFQLSGHQYQRLLTHLAVNGRCPHCRVKFQIDLFGSTGQPHCARDRTNRRQLEPVPERLLPFEPLDAGPVRGVRANGQHPSCSGSVGDALIPLDAAKSPVAATSQAGKSLNRWNRLPNAQRWAIVLTFVVVIGIFLFI